MKELRKEKLILFRNQVKEAIKAKCYDCMCGQKLTDCLMNNCPLFNFRPWASYKTVTAPVKPKTQVKNSIRK